MNILKPAFLAIVSLTSSAFSSFAQASVAAAGTATIITPISLIKTTDLSFGNLAVMSTAPGSVIMDPSGTLSTGGAGGVTIPTTTGTTSAATFEVTGAASFTYAISLPAATITLSNGSNSMDISDFTSYPSGTGTLSISGTQTLTIGATLSVTAGQTPGTYTNPATMPVTVNYNTN